MQGQSSLIFLAGASMGHHACTEPSCTHYREDKPGEDSMDWGETETELLSNFESAVWQKFGFPTDKEKSDKTTDKKIVWIVREPCLWGNTSNPPFTNPVKKKSGFTKGWKQQLAWLCANVTKSAYQHWKADQLTHCTFVPQKIRYCIFVGG